MHASLLSAARTSARATDALTKWTAVLLVLIVMVVATMPAKALEGDDGLFDPSSIVKLGNTYHIFSDGQGIIHKTSTDMVSWQDVGSVFGSGDGPSWIQSYAPGFAGYFWAPEITRMGGKFYIYYACSNGLGNEDQCIGCATSTDLTTWTDQGLVIYANASTPWGAIDPSICKDANGNYWMTWGSWRNGIYDARLDPSTGKFVSAKKYNIVDVPANGGNPTDSEASKMIYHDGYYYCFFNQGTCCNGISSTYTIWVARSTSPTGPFTGESVFIAPAAPIYAPGQFGYFVDDNGTEYCTFHYDDGNSNGYPRLFISHLIWNDGWPINTPNWIPDGTYVVKRSDNLAWADGAGGSLAPLIQSRYTADSNQQFEFASLGWNLYEMTTADSGLAVDAFDCANTNGTMMDIYSYWAGACQQWNVYHTSNGKYVFATYNGGGNGTDVIEDPNLSNSPGVQLDLWSYNGGSNQKWSVEAP